MEPEGLGRLDRVAGTPRMPSAVIRIAAGIAKISVAIVDGVAPIRKSSVIGAR